jgi:hypothetical protein
MMVVAGTLPIVACGQGSGDSQPGQEAGGGSQPLSEEAQLLVNQGNVAQRGGQYQEALGYFTQALEMYPEHPVPQFGTLMAAMAVGDSALVQEMRGKLATSGPELLDMLGPGSTMGGSMPGAGHVPPGALPEGHPVIEVPGTDTLTRPQEVIG